MKKVGKQKIKGTKEAEIQSAQPKRKVKQMEKNEALSLAVKAKITDGK